MGTRSMLGYEMEKKVDRQTRKVYGQYMQFDGYPRGVGHEFYETVIKSVSGDYYYDLKTGKPKETFFKRIQDYLNELQYRTGHSVDNHMVVSAARYMGRKDLCDTEWRYKFDRDGNFVMLSPGRFRMTIPWEFTLGLIRTLHSEFQDGLSPLTRKNPDGPFGTMWKEVSDLDECSEHQTILEWAREDKLVLHVADVFSYPSSKPFLEKLLKGEPAPAIAFPSLSLEIVNTNEDNSHEGAASDWVRHGRIKLNGTCVLKENNYGRRFAFRMDKVKTVDGLRIEIFNGRKWVDGSSG